MEDKTVQQSNARQSGSRAEKNADRKHFKSCPKCGLEVPIATIHCPQDGTTLSAPIESDDSLRERYEFHSVIGEGGMGVIYKARQIILNKPVAIKMIHPQLATEQAVRRFQLEGRAASRLSHQGIVGVTDFGVTANGQPYMVMDFVAGTTLSDLLKQEKSLGEARTINLAIQLCHALGHAHNNSVLHRDLKPSNIMVVRDGEKEFVKVMDFGIAKIINDTEYGALQLTKTGEAVGSPLYMSPEQCLSNNGDHRSDLYSLGCLMYECLTGSPPLIGKTTIETMMMQMNDAPISLEQTSKERKVSPRLARVVMKLLEKNPENRYQSMDALRSELESLQFGIGSRARSLTGEKSIPTRTKLIVGGAALVAIAAIGMGIFAIPATQKSGTFQSSQSADNNLTDKSVQPSAPSSDKTAKVALNEPSSSAAQTADRQLASIDTADTSGQDPNLKAFFAGHITPDATTISIPIAIAPSVRDQDLSVLKSAKSVTNLNLAIAPITDEALKYIKSLPLETLCLDDTRVSSLSELKGLRSLRDLSAARIKVTAETCSNLATLTNLHQLNLNGADITNDELQALKSLKNLSLLGLKNCTKVTTVGVLKLQSSLPNCQIAYSSAKDYLDQANSFAHAGEFSRAAEVINTAIHAYEAEQNPNMDVYVAYVRMRAAWQEKAHPSDNSAACKEIIETYKEAVNYLERTHKPETAAANLRLPLASALEFEQRFPQAVETRKKIADYNYSIKHFTLDTLANEEELAKDMMALNDQNAAIPILLRALKSYKIIHKETSEQAASSHQLVADCYNGKNDYENALKHYKAAESIFAAIHSPRRIDIMYNLIALYGMHGHFAERQNELKKCLSVMPKNDSRRAQLDLLMNKIEEKKD